MKRKRILAAVLATGGMFLLILDTQTAIQGAAAGVELCIRVLIPSLFPFFIVTTYLNSALLGLRVPGLDILGRLLHIPSGSESLLLLGLIGGYPVGAQLIADTYAKNQISRRTGSIMLGYCSNAGPAFIFGVTSSLFSSAKKSFILWGIHILSALITGCLLPKPEQSQAKFHEVPGISLVTALRRSISICASVCGWVVVFKIIMTYLEHLTTNQNIMTFLTGLLELSNGCLLLVTLNNESARFILCAAFLSLGGICVLMQTVSVTQGLGLGLYIPGKFMQTAISIMLSGILSLILFPEVTLSVIDLISCGLICIFIIAALTAYAKKVVEIQ